MIEKILETTRLRLRPMTEADAEFVVRWRNRKEIKMASSDRAGNSILTIEKHISWFRSTRKSRYDYVIELKPESTPVGVVSLEIIQLEGGGREAISSRYIGEPWAEGRGLSTEAAVAWFSFGFSEIGLDRIFSRTRETNQTNIRVNEKIGARRLADKDSDPGWVHFEFNRLDWEKR